MFTAKIMYCLWVTLAEKDDNFVIETTKPLPKKYNNMSQKEQIKFIKERILGRSNEELVQVSACIPKFTLDKGVKNTSLMAYNVEIKLGYLWQC